MNWHGDWAEELGGEPDVRIGMVWGWRMHRDHQPTCTLLTQRSLSLICGGTGQIKEVVVELP